LQYHAYYFRIDILYYLWDMPMRIL
jgi:hypothetical protein